MEYDLNQLGNPTKFQRLVNAILTARFGEDARLTPLQGTDGGSDGETAGENPHMEFRCDVTSSSSNDPLVEPPRPGRYLFQAKYHRTGEQRPSDLRTSVVREFKNALQDDVLARRDRDDVNYFFLVTNIRASESALRKVDEVRKELPRSHRQLHADIWWGERVTTSLDWAPELWHAFPELFPGHVPPVLATTSNPSVEGLSRTFRLAVTHQHSRDRTVKFRQIELDQELLDLFVDLDVRIHFDEDSLRLSSPKRLRRRYGQGRVGLHSLYTHSVSERPLSALELLISDGPGVQRILLEGGPGQGKSTVTQMAAQIYREKLLGIQTNAERDPTWQRRCQLRLPIRVELRDFARWLADAPDGTLEQFIAREISRDSGGTSVTVEDVHALVERSSVILLLDGLDEIGNETSRDKSLDAILDTVSRFENALRVDLRVVLTTRPPAVAGRWNKLDGFTRVVLTPMNARRIDDYLDRWLSAQIHAEEEQQRIRASFDGRRHDPHVEALARNPMQLSVLLQFIFLKGEAFPDRRAELYGDYFQIVIDRDVEKSPELREDRELVEGLHSFLGFRIHGMTEIDQGGRSLNRKEIVRLAGQWLNREGHSSELAEKYFALGEERFGLIVARSGEAQETNYGFEVQPIQEYFAAAYISNRMTDAKAHDVFQLLIHRNYWREVALFLAGLRRPNEKADLVARAKAADEEPGHGMEQQNGKAIVLQLVREGVLTQPRHVLREAMDFVMEILDPLALRVQRNPHATIEALADLGRRYGSQSTRDRVAQMVQTYSRSDDYDLVALVHRLAGKVLSRDQYSKLLLKYAGTQPDVRSVVRVTCPYVTPDTLESLSRRDGYWEGVNVPILARHLWRSAMRHGVVRDVAYPNGMHSSLVVQFTIGQLGYRYGYRQPLEIRGGRVPAIWKLMQNVQAIGWFLARQEENGAAADCWEGLKDESLQLSWDNGGEPLPEDVEECIRDLIHASAGVVSSLGNQDTSMVGEAGLAYVQAINTHLADPGLAGWIACRCAMEIVQGGRFLLFRRYSLPREAADDITDAVFDYYSRGELDFPQRWHYRELFLYGMPLALRVARGKAPVQLDQLIADAMRGRLQPDTRRYTGWLGEVPIPRALVRLLVDAFRDDLSLLLRLVGERGVTGVISGRRLRVQDTQRILKICRGTNDPEILRGAGDVLVNTTFARIAEPELVAKIMSVAPSNALVARVLYSTREGAARREFSTAEKELARRVAQLILDGPEGHRFRVVNRAATFAGDRKASGSTPLFEEHSGLLRLGRD